MGYLTVLGALLAAAFLAGRYVHPAESASRLSGLAFFKLEYFLIGLILMMVFPDSFLPLFERTRNSLIMFCVSWIGLFFGCGLEYRIHQTFSPRILVLNLLEPAIVFLATSFVSALFLYLRFDGWQYTNAAILTGVFCSFTIYRRKGFFCRDNNAAHHPVLDNLLPLGNVFPVLALSVVSIFLFSARETTIISFTFSGTTAMIMFHILTGVAGGILLNILIAGAHTTGSLMLILGGSAALSGGIAYAFKLSPLFLGMLTGAFLINATLKRLQVLDAVNTVNDYIEKALMFLIGTMAAPLILILQEEALLIILFAAVLVAFRMLLKYGISRMWSTHIIHTPKTSPSLWIGLTGQGYLAAAAAIECSLQVHLLPSIFFLFILVLVMNQLTVGLFVWSVRSETTSETPGSA
jgi:hypothetical protein